MDKGGINKVLTYLGLMKHPSILVLALVLSVPSVLAQPEVSLGADLVSRYVWRGLDFGQSAAVQPGPCRCFRCCCARCRASASAAASSARAVRRAHSASSGSSAGG